MEVGRVEESRRHVTSVLQWKVDVDCLRGKVVGDSVFSPKFRTSDAGAGSSEEWKLILCPKGEIDEDKGFMSLFLLNANPSDVTVSSSFALLDRAGRKVHEVVLENQFIEKGMSRGWGKFMEENFMLDPRSNILKDGEFTILCKITSEAAVERLSKRTRFFDDFGKLMADSAFSDVIVEADGQSFKLHKCVLAAHSVVFHVMFTTEMKEKTQSVVRIEDVEIEVLREFFRFVYTGAVGNTKGIVCKLLMAADKYCVDKLRELCEDAMCRDLSRVNAVEYLESAVMINAERLKFRAMSYINSHIDDFVGDAKFREFGEQHVEVLFEMLRLKIV